jgi:hypothetical protein
MIEDSKKSFYHGCAHQYTRLFMLLQDMLLQGNTISETIYEAKQIICPLGMEVKNTCVQE